MSMVTQLVANWDQCPSLLPPAQKLLHGITPPRLTFSSQEFSFEFVFSLTLFLEVVFLLQFSC